MKTRALATAIALTSAATFSVLTGAPAHASDRCQWSPTTTSPGSPAALTSTKYNNYNLYSGPSTSCSKTGATVPKHVWVELRCGTPNEARNLWEYVAIPGGKQGWIASANFEVYVNSGSELGC